MDELLEKIIVEGRAQDLFREAERVMGTEGLIWCTVPFWNEKDAVEIINRVFEG